MTKPKQTVEAMKKWCPSPKGDQPVGQHAQVPRMTEENAGDAGHAENIALSKALVRTFQGNKKTHDLFVLQWRMFPKEGSYPDDGSAACGCSCSCS